MEEPIRPYYIDLFAGCGGLSLGLGNAGWTGLFAIEKSPDAFKTLRHNLIDSKSHFQWPSWLPQRSYSIEYVLRRYRSDLLALRNNVDLITGGPPCQGFSMAGRREESDKRNILVKSYIRFVKTVQPKLIFFENVKGFTQEFKKNSEQGIVYSKYVVDRLEKAGYFVFGELVNFGEYGVPQDRTRFLLFGIRKDIEGASEAVAKSFFSKLRHQRLDFLKNKNLPLWPTLGQAISDLCLRHGSRVSSETDRFNTGVYGPTTGLYQRFMRKGGPKDVPDSHRFANHSPEIRERLERILEYSKRNKTISDDLRMEWNLKKHRIVLLDSTTPSKTLTSNPDDLVHYSEPRSLTVREYARIQTFPDWFELKGKYTTGGDRRKTDVPRFTQVGNSIPPIFGEQCGIVMRHFIE